MKANAVPNRVPKPPPRTRSSQVNPPQIWPTAREIAWRIATHNPSDGGSNPPRPMRLRSPSALRSGIEEHALAMGAWGPGIFSNDLAADARAEWRDALIAGEDPPDASARILSEYSAALDETEFWTGLAAAQHETGHLQPAVRDRALAIIEAGGDIEDWEESG